MNRRLTLAAVAVAITLSTLPPARAGNPPVLIQVGSRINLSNNSFNPALQEASGLGLAKNGTKLWSISDEEFSIYKMNLDGSYVTQFDPTRASSANPVSNTDFEGITF